MGYGHLDGLKGRVNRPGLYQLAYIAPLSAFLDIKEVADVNGEGAARIEIVGDHTFGANEGFERIFTTKDTAQLLAESIGEKDGKSHDTKVNFFYPGAYADAMGFADKAQYDDHIILVQTLENQWIQVGYKNLGADITSNFDSGTLSSGRKGWSFVAQAYGRLCLYDGVITEKPVVP